MMTKIAAFLFSILIFTSATSSAERDEGGGNELSYSRVEQRRPETRCLSYRTPDGLKKLCGCTKREKRRWFRASSWVWDCGTKVFQAKAPLRSKFDKLRFGGQKDEFTSSTGNLFPVKRTCQIRSDSGGSGLFLARRYNRKTRRRYGHEGVDYAAPIGTPVRVSWSGYVDKVSSGERVGIMVTTIHPQQDIQVRYMHLKKSYVRKNQRLTAGQLIGEVGSSGNTRGTTPHVHYDIRRRGTNGLVNPDFYFPLSDCTCYPRPCRR